jgi:cytochrome c-type biogenesis protein CcmH
MSALPRSRSTGFMRSRLPWRAFPEMTAPPQRHTTRLVALALVTLILALSPTLLCAQADAAAPRTTLLAIEHQVMCVTCKIPLTVAESPQAARERVFIRGLIAERQTEAQIKNSLVAQYGPSVLDLPSTKGFDLAAYLVPVAMMLTLLALLAFLLPSWRRHARARRSTAEDAPELSASDAARLDADLAHFD